MSGINTGILTNAFPLTAEQVKAVENRVLEAEETVVFLDENEELCYAMPFNPELIKELAWHNAYELKKTNNMILKRHYKKQTLDSIFLNEVLQKQTLSATWQHIFTAASLLDMNLLDNFILE